jgi:hypothetical protein
MKSVGVTESEEESIVDLRKKSVAVEDMQTAVD